MLALLLFVISLRVGAAPNTVTAPICKQDGPKIPDFKQRTDLVILPADPPASAGGLGPEHHSIQAEINQKSITVKYVRFPAIGSSSRGTVFAFCGGPTECSKLPVEGIPGDYDVITMDPMGLGENYSPSMPAEMKSVDSQAQAAQAIVKQLGLKNYLFDGRSIGTATATAAAAKIGDSDLPQPTAVILEGTFGPKSMPSRDFVRDSNRAWALLDSANRAQFIKLYNAYGKAHPNDRQRALDLLFVLLRNGPEEMAGYITRLNQMSDQDWTKNIDRILGAAKGTVEDKGDAGESLYQAFGCQIINHSQNPAEGHILFDKRLNIIATDDDSYSCPCRTLPKDYNPCEYQIKAPILYLQGEYDPMAAKTGAQAHSECQKSAKVKKFIVVKDAGHSLTDAPGLFASCVSTIYDAANGANLNSLSENKDWSKGCNVQLGNPYKTKTTE